VNDEVGVVLDGERVTGLGGGARSQCGQQWVLGACATPSREISVPGLSNFSSGTGFNENIWGERYSHTCVHQVCSMASNTVASLTILV